MDVALLARTLGLFHWVIGWSSLFGMIAMLLLRSNRRSSPSLRVHKRTPPPLQHWANGHRLARKQELRVRSRTADTATVVSITSTQYLMGGRLLVASTIGLLRWWGQASRGASAGSRLAASSYQIKHLPNSRRVRRIVCLLFVYSRLRRALSAEAMILTPKFLPRKFCGELMGMGNSSKRCVVVARCSLGCRIQTFSRSTLTHSGV